MTIIIYYTNVYIYILHCHLNIVLILDLDLDLMAVKVPPAVRELQGNSERWRQRATNVGMDPEAMGGHGW